MITPIIVNVSLEKLINNMSPDILLKLKKAIDEKLASFAIKSEPVETILIMDVFSTRTALALSSADIKYLSDLRKYSQEQLKLIRGIGAKCLKEIQQVRIKYNV